MNLIPTGQSPKISLNNKQMTSFFQNLYKYKESDQRNKKENFLTEILAHCLRVDQHFRNDFLAFVGITSTVVEFDCQTQKRVTSNCQPDLHIVVNRNTLVLIECKVDAKQGASEKGNQLENYSDYLLDCSWPKKHLIYLTKNYEEAGAFPDQLNFRHIRWYQVYDLINSDSNEFTKELSNYLKSERMSRNISFSMSELSALRSFKETYNTMNDFLANVKGILRQHTKTRINDFKTIESSSIGIGCDFFGGILWMGFFQYEHNEEMQICISIEDVPKKSRSFKILDTELQLLNWDYYDSTDNEKRTWYNTKGLSFFFNEDVFEYGRAYDFLESEILKIKKWLTYSGQA